MVPVFPTPILSIAADAVRDLEGRDALFSLWTIFTKCKGSLQNGPRLENITWRLWHRELKLVDREKKSRHVKENAVFGESITVEKSAYLPPTPSETLCSTRLLPQPSLDITNTPLTDPQIVTPQCAASKTPSYFPSPLLSPSTVQQPLALPSPPTGAPRSVGRIICDLLPMPPASSLNKGPAELPLSDVRLINSSAVSSRTLADDATLSEVNPSIHTTPITTPSADMVRPTNISLPGPFGAVPRNTTSCLPTPEMEVGDFVHPIVHSSFPSQTPSPSSLVASTSSVPELSFSTIPGSSSMLYESAAPSGTHGIVNLVTPHSTSGQFAGPVQHSVDESASHHSAEVMLPPSHPPQSSPANMAIEVSPTDSLVPRAANQPVDPPRLVVVNPTPNPTPHPTPPTTPHINGVGRQWLSPPIRGSSRVAAKAMLAEKTPPGPMNPAPNSLVHDPPLDQPRDLVAQGDTVIPLDFTSLAGQPFPQQASRSAIRGQYVSESARDSADWHSVSSIASSNYSHTTVASNLSSTATASTTSVSSNGGMDDEEKVTEFDVRAGYLHIVGNALHPTITRSGSPSTIKSTSTDHAWTVMASGFGVNSEKVDVGDDKQFIKGVINEGEHLALASKPQPSNEAKHLKRNSAPVPLTSSTALILSPTHAAMVCCSPETSSQPPSPKAMGFDLAVNTKEGVYPTTTGDHSTSQGRSGGTKGSQTSSRNRSVAADLSGLGTLGGYTITAAYPPPSMVVRKQVAVGAGKGKVKVAIRGLGKARPARRHSAGPGLDVGGKGKEREVKSLHSEPQERPLIDQQLDCQPPMPHGLTLITEEKPPQSATAAQIEIPAAKLLLPDGPISENNLKRPPRFNIGSNSDEGSGVGSKSAGSGGSSVSGGHSQLVKKLTEDKVVPHRRMAVNAVVNLDALLLKQQERQQRPEVIKEVQHRQAVHSDATSHASSPTRKSKKPNNRHGKKHSIQSTSDQSSVSRTNTDGAHSPTWMSEKAKGKLRVLDHGPTAPKQASKSKSKSTPNLGVLDPVLAAKVRDSLADPLLPKGRPVVVATESEDETDTEDGWSSEELTDQAQEQFKRELALRQERDRQEADRQQHELLLRKIYMQQQQPRPAGIQRTHSSHYPTANNARIGKAATQRPRQQQQREFALHHAKLEQAAREAQRQRDMIKKLPTESFQNLAKARANSVGLLTQLLNPSSEALPPNHPYRRGFSSGAIQPLGLTSTVAMQLTTSEPGPSAVTPAIQASHASSTALPDANPPVLNDYSKKPDRSQPPPAPRLQRNADECKKRVPSIASSPIRGMPIQPTKSFAALPVSSQVQVGSVSAKGPPSVAITTEVLANKAYRPKGPPKDQEMEEDSGSEPETGKIQVSKSIAEQKLKALAERRGIKQNQAATQAGPSKQAARVDEEVPAWARISQHQNWQDQRRSSHGLQFTPVSRPPATAPIPLGHPYNLPPPDPPTTPRTTRRQMLATELSESLRRNLLWERQVSKNNVAGMKRSSSTIVGRNGTQPFIGMPRVVQLHAKGTIPPDQQDDPSKRVLGVLSDENEREEMRKHAIARNRSWANDFHYAGW